MYQLILALDHEDQIAEKENFNDYDVNKDGLLDEKEVTSWMIPDNE